MPFSPEHPRFLFDNDGNNFVASLTDDLEGDIQELIDECPPEITTYLFCPGAGTYYYPTRIGITDPRKKRMNAYLAEGIDPMGLTLKALRSAGRETFLTFRMNDVHNPTDPDQWNTPVIRREHPEMIVDPKGAREPDADWMCWCLDYSQPEVRDHMISLFEELAEHYPIDGFQLDWLRFPRHLSGDPEMVWSKREHLTTVVREAHRIFSARGAKLAVRVPTSLAGCRYLGLDVVSWARSGWIEMVTVCPFLTTDFTMPIQELREAMQPASIPVYAGFDFAHGWQIHSPESMRAAATSLYACGADGIYLFNYPCWTQCTVARSEAMAAGLSRPETAGAKPLLFSLPITHHIRKEVIDGPGILPIEVAPGASVTVELFLPGRALPARRILAHIVGPGAFTLGVNGQSTLDLPDRRQTEIFPWYVGKEGWLKEFSFTEKDCRSFRVTPESLQSGQNVLTFTNQGSEPATIRRFNLGLL
jgi:hypothetical protein